MATPTVTIRPDAFYTDGSAFPAADFAGYEVSIDNAAFVASPLPYAGGDVALGTLANGPHSVRARVKSVNGETSDLATVSFQVDNRKPKPPFLSAS